jgi:hypothetical protein
MAKTVKFEQTGNRQVSNLQKSISDATSQLRNGPMGAGNLVTGVVLPDNTPVQVNTGLGYPLQGWSIHRYQNATYGGCVTEVDADESSVTLVSYGDAVATIWFW